MSDFKHKNCPQRCHRCPDMDGAVMPWCWGTIIHSVNERDLLACTCRAEYAARSTEDRVRRLESEVSALRAQLGERP